MEGVWIVVGVAVLLLLWVAVLFNNLVRGRNHCNKPGRTSTPS